MSSIPIHDMLWWGYKIIAQTLGLHYDTVRKNINSRRGHWAYVPDPIDMEGVSKYLWRRRDVIAWADTPRSDLALDEAGMGGHNVESDQTRRARKNADMGNSDQIPGGAGSTEENYVQAVRLIRKGSQ